MSWVREPGSEPIPGYRLIQPLGSGGFGEVWKCEAPGGVHKAIKIVYGNLNSLDVDAVRAEQERKALNRIIDVKHPFICKVDRIDELNGELFIVMDLAEKTLHDRFQECQSAGMIGIPHDELLRNMRDAAEALDYMFEKHDLQHLDVKPRNLFLQGDRVLVADFGLVKHLNAQSSGILGGVTPLYASPETFNGKITRHSDLYSLAIVYQEMLTGHRPFAGKNVRALAQQHLQGEPDVRALPAAERPTVARALAKSPEKRWPTCMEFVKALYNARGANRAPAKKQEANLVGAGVKSKTLADTLEDFALEELAPAEPPVLDHVAQNSQPHDEDDESSQNVLEVADMGVTVAQPDSGALRPTLFIGVGSFGRKALLELRCRFVDRFGDLDKVPLLRFLCIDPDPDAVNQAVRGVPEVALNRNEVMHLPLQPVSNYRRRIIEQLSEWLPREKLYGMPRSLQPQGSRALGRLSFVDNFQKVQARLRNEIREATSPEVIYQSVTQTGLAVRDNQPRVYIIASAGGGSSGMLVDLGYALKRQLAHLRHPDAQVILFLLCSAPNDPASPKAELANVYATLTELNHYCDPTNVFSAQYGAEGQRIVDQGSSFASVYLLPLPHRGPDALEDVLAHLGSFVFHETATPLGGRLEQLRLASLAGADPNNSFNAPFRSLGTYAVWFPRGLLLRLASRLACRKLIETWLNADDSELPGDVVPANIEATCQAIVDDPKYSVEALLPRIEEASRAAKITELGATPAEAVTGILANLQEQSTRSVAQEDPGNWARQALNKVREWLGGDEATGQLADWRKTRVNRALHLAAQKVAEEAAKDFVSGMARVMDFPGARLAAAEQALSRLEEYCKSQIVAQRERLNAQKAKTKQTFLQMDAALAECLSGGGGGFRWFGNRSNRRLLMTFMETLSNFARQRLHEEHLAAVEHFFVALQGQLNDQRRDLGFCRQRLRHLQENLEAMPVGENEDLTATRPGAEHTVTHSPVPSTEAYWEAIRQSHTARVLLPDGEEELERAAIKLLQRLKPADWAQLDKDLHQRVLDPLGGLHRACINSGDLTRALTAPLVDETINLLGNHLPVMDVAQILAAEFGCSFDGQGGTDQIPDTAELVTSTQAYLDRAAPLIGQADGEKQHSFLLIPASHAGQSLSKALEAVLPNLKYVPVPGQSDLMICRDQGPLSIRDLSRLLKISAQAYQHLAPVPQSSPHARFDLLDWMPLDP